jgi:hypothetical protein
MKMTRWARAFTLALLATFATTLYGQNFPMPTPAQQQGIDNDTARHFGDAPANPGPMAVDLSPSLTPAAIDKATRKVADWELNRARPYFDRIWTWSVLYTGFMAASESTGDPKYRDAMTAMSQTFDWSLRSRLPNADDQSVAQTYLELYLLDGKKDNRKIAPTRSDLDAVMKLNTLKPGDPRLPWWWCDSLFMAPPVWSRMYAATGDRSYVDYIDKQWQLTSDLLYDQDEHLYEQARAERTKGLLVARRRLGDGWHRAYARLSAAGRSSSRVLRDPVATDGSTRGRLAGKRWPMDIGVAGSAKLSGAGDVGFGVDGLCDDLGRE